MVQTTFVASICTLSWINQKTGLPEHDKDGPPRTFPGNQVTREDDTLPFRFLNFVEAAISVDGATPPKIISSRWTPDSKIYKNPSFLKIKSEAFKPIQSISQRGNCVIFTQTVGARTVSPEVIGQAAGAAAGGVLLPIVGPIIGRKVAHQVSGFPPIWTTISLTLYADGRTDAKVVCNSLFPSMNFYTLRGGTAAKRESSSYELKGQSYDAVPNLKNWETNGWGKLSQNASGPSPGNPWGFAKSDLAVRPVDSGRRTV